MPISFPTFTPESYARAAKKATLPEGFAKFIVTSAVFGNSKTSGKPMFTLGVTPLRDPDDLKSAMTKFKTNVYVVVPTPAEEGDDAGQVAEARGKQGIHRVMGALYGSEIVPDMPRGAKDDEGKWRKERLYKGELVAADQEEACKADAYATAMSVAEKLANEIDEAGEGKCAESIKGNVVLGKIKADSNSPTGIKVELYSYLPKDAEVLTPAQLSV